MSVEGNSPKRATFGWIALATAILGAALGCALAWAGYQWLGRELPDVAVLRSKYAQVIYRGPSEPVQIRLKDSPPPGWTRYDAISKNAIGAVVVSEDWSFFSHEGYDPDELKAAIQEDLQERRFARGASTITMQVVKNVFLSQEKTLYRKAKEFVLALRLDSKVSKRKILETYFNVVEWGEGTFGISAASWKYFNKAPADLTPKEGAFLAMLLPSPKRYSQSFRNHRLTPYARKTIDSILGKMEKAKYIDEATRDSEREKPLSFETGEGTSANADAPNGTDKISTEPSEDESGDTETPRELDLGEGDGQNN